MIAATVKHTSIHCAHQAIKTKRSAQNVMLLPVIAMVFALQGCQLFTPKLSTPIIHPQFLPECKTPVQQSIVECLPPFRITGKLGLKSIEHSGSAFYAWSQNAGVYQLSISGILGIGQTSIEGSPTSVKLQNSNVGVLEAKNPDELLLQATGWNAPISALPYWITGKARHDADIKSLDTQGRMATLSDDDWYVAFAYLERETLPNKLTMTKLAHGDNTRVILTIATRDAVENLQDSAPEEYSQSPENK